MMIVAAYSIITIWTRRNNLQFAISNLKYNLEKSFSDYNDLLINTSSHNDEQEYEIEYKLAFLNMSEVN